MSDSEYSRRRRTQALGSRLAIEVFVAIQFFEINIFTVGTFAVSVQKLLSAAVLPFAVVLMRRLRFPLTLLILLVLMLLANSGWYLAQGMFFDSRMLSADASVVLMMVGATVFYTALTIRSNGVALLGKAWVRWGLLTSIVCTFQAVALLPLFNVPAQYLALRKTAIGLVRAVGFKADPNFQALMLVGAALFVVVYWRAGIRQLLTLFILSLGLLATFSRMGMLLFGVVVVALPLTVAVHRGRIVRGSIRTIVTMALAATVVVFAWRGHILPKSLEGFLTERWTDAWSVLHIVVSTGASGLTGAGQHVTSAGSRALVAYGAFRLFRANPFFGIGAERSAPLIYALVGQRNVAHNTYLQFVMVGGAVGVVLLLVYFLPLVMIIRGRSLPERDNGEMERAWISSLWLYILIACAFFFLSLNDNSILLLPPAVALATAHARRVERSSQ